MANEFKARNGVITPVIQSTVPTGTAPLTVASTTQVTNLNADLLDGQEGSYYNNAANLTGTVPSAVLANSSLFIGTTQVALNRSSASLSLTGVSIDGTAALATNIAGGASNRLVFQSNSGTTAFVDAPTTTDTYLKWSGSAFQWTEVSGGITTGKAIAMAMVFG